MMIARRLNVAGQEPEQGEAVIPRPSLTFPALRTTVATVAPERVLEFYAKALKAFIRADDEGRAVPIHMLRREQVPVVETEQQPETVRRPHTIEETLKSGDIQTRKVTIREAGDIVCAAHKAVAFALPTGPEGLTENRRTVALVDAGTLTAVLRNKPD